MRKYIFLSIFLVFTSLVVAQDLSGVKIYINPGHGGYDSDDRNMKIYPFDGGDPAGFWESKSNLHKGLMLDTLLRNAGASTKLSRITNTTADDRSLSAIVAESNAYNPDFMLSIHSNAGVNNYILMLYAGVDPGDTYSYYSPTPCSDEGRAISTILAQNLYKNQITCWGGAYTVRGDKTFARLAMGWSNGYGALRGLTSPGVISEGAMHDYIPETYRLMNMEYKWMESWNFFRTFATYFKSEQIPYGVVAGSVRDGNNKIEFPSFYKIRDSRDELLPLHAANVSLVQGTDTVARYVTDDMYNGVFLFKNMAPGTYTLHCKVADYYENIQKDIVVVKDEITYFNFDMSKVRSTPPEVVSHLPAPQSPTDSVECSTEIVLNFNWDMEETSTRNAFSITPHVDGELTFENSQRTLRFVPAEGLDIATHYTVKLAKTASHPDTTQTNTMVDDFELEFVTKSRGNLSMLLHYPAMNDTAIALRPAMFLVFDQELDTRGIASKFSLADSEGNVVTLNARSFKNNQAPAPYGSTQFELSKDLKPDTRYTLTVDETLEDKIGIQLGQDLSISFTTGSNTASDAPIINDMDTLLYTYDADRSKGVQSASVFRNTTRKLYGMASNELKYIFNENEAEVFYQAKDPAAIVSSADYTFGLHVFGNFSFNELWAEWSVDGDIKYAKVCELDFAGWKYLQVNLRDYLPQGVEYQLTALKLVHKKGFFSTSGSLYLDDMTLVKTPFTSLESVDTDHTLSIYPNPATDVVRILNASLLATPCDMKLYSLTGSLVKEASGCEMHLYDVPNGTYILRAHLSDGAHYSTTLIVR